MMEKQPPKQIYLQAYDSDSYDDNTWCSDKQNEDDIEYILQSEYDQLKSENERLQKYKEKLISDATQNEFVLLAYHDSLKEMKARVQELEQEQRWIPVSDRKPELDKNSNEDGTINVLVYIKNYKRILDATYYPKMAVWNMPYGWGDETDNITHWRCKPQPPEDGE